jgi:hypothetical protein
MDRVRSQGVATAERAERETGGGGGAMTKGKFGYATEEALYADYASKVDAGKAEGPKSSIEDFRTFLRSVGCEEVVFDGVRCWQFPPLADCRREFERRNGPWKWNKSVMEWQD